jgi:hypothetical protein
VRVVAEVDFGSNARAWDEWRRYEALTNYALAPYPLWSVCAYNSRVLADPVLTTGELTHPFVRRDGAGVTNPSDADPAEILIRTDAGVEAPPPVEPAAAFAELSDFTGLHAGLRALLRDSALDTDRGQGRGYRSARGRCQRSAAR